MPSEGASSSLGPGVGSIQGTSAMGALPGQGPAARAHTVPHPGEGQLGVLGQSQLLAQAPL